MNILIADLKQIRKKKFAKIFNYSEMISFMQYRYSSIKFC